MVTVQNIGVQLTKPVKELAEWNFPFSQTLEKYCSLFNTTPNKSFGEAGLVLQNSTAVYAHRIDSLWHKIEYFKDIFSTNEHDETTKNTVKKRDRRSNLRLLDFKTINFDAEVEKNIDIKRNHTMSDTVKSKSRRFTQLEKGIAQHISINIYDVNGEVIGKKYDFRCNQNISMDGVLVDEFTPQDFCCSVDSAGRKSSLSSNHSRAFESLDSTVHDYENNDDDPMEDHCEMMSSYDLAQQDLSLSRNTDDAFMKTSLDIASDNCNASLAPETCLNTPSTRNSPIVTTIDNSISANNKTTNDICLNNGIKENLDACSLLDSPPESIHSKGRRTSLDDSTIEKDANHDQSSAKLDVDTIQSTPNRNTGNKKQRSTAKSVQKLCKRKLVMRQKRKSATKKVLAHVFEESNKPSRAGDRSNILKLSLRTCLKYIREYDPLQYDDVTNVTDLLGFRLRVNAAESDVQANDDATTTSNDDGISELCSPKPVETPPLRKEDFCDTWLRSNSSIFLPENVDRWHELMQPKLREAEQRSTFCIRDYASRIIETLKTSGQRKISFDTVIHTERACEVARYFLASLDLASRRNVDINMDQKLEHNIEICLPERDGRCSSNEDRGDSHD